MFFCWLDVLSYFFFFFFFYMIVLIKICTLWNTWWWSMVSLFQALIVTAIVRSNYLYLYVIARSMGCLRKMTSIFHAPIKWKVNYRITIWWVITSLHDLYIYIWRMDYILFLARKDRSWFVQEWNCICDERTGITGHPVETVTSFNSCFSRSRKWTGNATGSIKSMARLL